MIDAKHDPATGEWSIAAGDRHVFKVFGYPDWDVWWPSVRQSWMEETGQLCADKVRQVRHQFNGIISRIRYGCRCDDCMAAVTARARQVIAEVRAEVAEVRADQAALVAAARADPFRIRTMPQRAPRPAKAVPSEPEVVPLLAVSYINARKRYMDTGTIADKEAMLACVTLTVPDLDTIGRDWEPAAPETPARTPHRDHAWRRGVAEAAAIAAAIIACMTAAPAALAIAGALLAASVALFPWPKRRR